MPIDIKIVVADAAPLITLAAARGLDYLLYPRLPVLIPDAVFHEAASVADKLGAQAIIDWYRAHSGMVRVEPTELFQRETKVLELMGGRLPRDWVKGPRWSWCARTRLLRALLLSDDRDAERLSVVDPQKLILLTTWDYLRQLEDAQRIQSADAVVAAARDAGRHPSKRDLWSQHDPDIRDAVIRIIRGK